MLFLAFLIVSCGKPRAERGTSEPITIARDSITITVDPELGGRLVSLTYGGRELLNTARDSTNFRLGSTAWPSPQADWGWPPPAAIDRDAYTVQRVTDHQILLISPPDSRTGLVMQKRYLLGPDSDVGLIYWLTNRGDSTLSVAAWENTRLPYAGRIEFISDSVRTEKSVGVVESQDSLRTIHFDGRHDRPAKVFASLDTVPVIFYGDSLILEKHTAVQDFYRVAPDQAPLEVYLDPVTGFAEFELQGDYRRLGYGETSTLRTRWVIRPRGVE